MTPQEIIDDARFLLNDIDAPYRQGDNELVVYVNDAIKEIATFLPNWMAEIVDFVCATGAEQIAPYTNYVAVLDVIQIKNGAFVLPMDKGAMTAFDPTWTTHAGAAAQNWAPHEKDPRHFYLYPPSPAGGQTLRIKAIPVPPEFALAAEITVLPENWKPAIVDYVVGRSEMKDDEHVNSNRASIELKSFYDKLKAGQ